MHELVHTRPIIDWMSIKCWLSIGEVVEGVQTKCLPSTVNWMTKMLTMSIYQLSTNTLATVPPSRSISLVSELEQIFPNTKSSSSSEISNIWWDIEQNTHQVWHNSNLKSKRNIELIDTIAADIALSEIHSSWFIWKTIRSLFLHSMISYNIIIHNYESSISQIVSATDCRKVFNVNSQVITCTDTCMYRYPNWVGKSCTFSWVRELMSTKWEILKSRDLSLHIIFFL